MKTVVALIAGAALLAGAAGNADAARKASFNCKKARAPVEVAICSDDRLAAQDRQLGKVYQAYRRALNKARKKDDAAYLKTSHRGWLKARLLVCGLPARGKWQPKKNAIDCLNAVYLARVASLSASLDELGKSQGKACRKTDGNTLQCRFRIGRKAGSAALELTRSKDLIVGLSLPKGQSQVLTLDADSVEPGDDGPRAPAIGDFNFDGYQDFSLISFLPAGPNIPSLYWLYDPQTGTYKRHDRLSEVTSAVFDKLTGTVASFWRGSAANHGRTVYVWRSGTLAQVIELDCQLGDGGQAMLKITLDGGQPVERTAPTYDACLAALE